MKHFLGSNLLMNRLYGYEFWTFVPEKLTVRLNATCDMFASLSDRHTKLFHMSGVIHVAYHVTLDGAELLIMITLKAALRGLRLPHKSRTLCVDQLCINQCDRQEVCCSSKMHVRDLSSRTACCAIPRFALRRRDIEEFCSCVFHQFNTGNFLSLRKGTV